MISNWQMASDTFIVKFSPVSGFQRHKSDNGRIEDAICSSKFLSNGLFPSKVLA